MSDLDGIPKSLHWYFRDPGAWDHVKQEIRDHDKDCRSLPDIWTARTGGVTGLSDIDRCDDCEVMFYTEGIFGQFSDDPDDDTVLQTVDLEDGESYDAKLCDCCGRKRRAQ